MKERDREEERCVVKLVSNSQLQTSLTFTENALMEANTNLEKNTRIYVKLKKQIRIHKTASSFHCTFSKIN